jgi:DNA-binding response OmpR family regulator
MAKKILLIEDEQVLADVLISKLQKEGYETNVAYEGEDGYKKILEWKPELILLDIVLPKMNGYEILEKMQAASNKIPVIVISNSGQPVEIERTKKLGAVDHLVKTQFDPAEVITKVNTYLNTGQTTPAAPPSPINPATPTENRGIKVLLAEDDKFLRDICGTKLMKEGFQVVEAIDGQDVIKVLSKEKPNIVLLDIVLPSVNGFEILAQIRGNANPEIAKIPVLMLSNLGQEDDIKKAMELGANDYLIKSNFTTQEITDKIKKTLKIN